MNTRPILTLGSSANISKTAPSPKTKEVYAPLIPKKVSSTKTVSKPNSSNLKDNKEVSKPSLSKKELRSLQIQAAVEKRIAAYNE
ncbi:MAG: hypothetical protein HQ490_02385, partial [Lutibacter sp.]|nr:hypothetical protein [Lutibacter sp.]